MTIAESLVDIAVLDPGYDPAVVALADLQVRDLYGVARAGTVTTAWNRMIAALEDTGEVGPAKVWGTTLRVGPVSAALANSCAAAGLDFDDIADSCAAHLSGVVVPALASLAHRFSQADGMDGYLTGLRAARGLASLFTMQVFRAGYQNTCLIGTLAAVVALSRALKLDRVQILNALALAAPHMIGLRKHTGTDFKAGQTGMASATAVRSVLLAAQGFTADPAAVDEVAELVGVPRGSIVAFGETDPTPLPVATKVYPCVGSTHTAVEASARLAGRALRSRTLSELVVHADQKAFNSSGFSMPSTGNEARFSMTYTVATAWLERGLTLADFSDEAVADPARRELASRVRLVPDDDYLQVPGHAISPSKVVAVFDDGSTDEESIAEALGFPGRRLDPAGYETKFLDCVSSVTTESEARDALDAITAEGLFGYLDQPVGAASR